MLMPLVSIFDVAKYILQKHHDITCMKLHKLAYYCQAWSLVWDEMPIFAEPIKAWSSGPVIEELYVTHKETHIINLDIIMPLARNKLHEGQIATINAVLRSYATLSANQLYNLISNELPYLQARHGLSDLERGDREIDLHSMLTFYTDVFIKNS